jgi:hypothetical protein
VAIPVEFNAAVLMKQGLSLARRTF